MNIFKRKRDKKLIFLKFAAVSGAMALPIALSAKNETRVKCREIKQL